MHICAAVLPLPVVVYSSFSRLLAVVFAFGCQPSSGCCLSIEMGSTLDLLNWKETPKGLFYELPCLPYELPLDWESGLGIKASLNISNSDRVKANRVYEITVT